MLFTPGRIGTLGVANRLVRSATAERMADERGVPLPSLGDLYRELATGGIGLLITGHMYVHPSGKCHPEMTAVDRDEILPALAALAKPVREEGSAIVGQINHGGGRSSPEVLPQVMAPSAPTDTADSLPTREMSSADIKHTIRAFAAAARRVQGAGFDGVQIHAAHGYLISQFLSPLANQRRDQWGGSLENRSRFLRQVCQAVREELGPGYPLMIKFGIADGRSGGLSLPEGLEIISRFESWGLDAVEISSGFSGELFSSIQKGISSPEKEGYFLGFAKKARPATRLPIISVGGYRSRQVMEGVLQEGSADFISLCRPLIREPHLPRLFHSGKLERSDCLSANLCWAENYGEGISCKCYPARKPGPETSALPG